MINNSMMTTKKKRLPPYKRLIIPYMQDIQCDRVEYQGRVWRWARPMGIFYQNDEDEKGIKSYTSKDRQINIIMGEILDIMSERRIRKGTIVKI